MIEEGVVRWGIGDDFEAVDASREIAMAFVHRFDETINFPKASEIEAWGVEALDVYALIKFVGLPEGTSERGGAAEEAAVDPEHVSGVCEMALDAFAGGTTFVKGATELDDEADALAVAGEIDIHRTEAIAMVSREGKSRFGDEGILHPFTRRRSQPGFTISRQIITLLESVQATVKLVGREPSSALPCDHDCAPSAVVLDYSSRPA